MFHYFPLRGLAVSLAGMSITKDGVAFAERHPILERFVGALVRCEERVVTEAETLMGVEEKPAEAAPASKLSLKK